MKDDNERTLDKVTMAIQVAAVRAPYGEKWGPEFLLEVGLADIVGGALATGLSKEELQARAGEMFDKGVSAIGADTVETMKRMRVAREAKRS